MSRQIKRATLAWALLGLVLAPAASALPGASHLGGWWAAAWQVLAEWFDVEASRGATAAKAGPCIDPLGKPIPGCMQQGATPGREPLRRVGICIDPNGKPIPGCLPQGAAPGREPQRRSGPCIDPDGHTIPGCTS